MFAIADVIEVVIANVIVIVIAEVIAIVIAGAHVIGGGFAGAGAPS